MKKNVCSHHSLGKIKNTRTRINFFFFFFGKMNFFVWVISFLPFMGLGWKESIQESSHVVIFLFFFIKELLETFISDVGTGLCVGAGEGFQYADIEVTDFLWFERKSSSLTKFHLNVCILDQLHPGTYKMQYTQTQLSPQQTRASKVLFPSWVSSFWVGMTPATNRKKILPSRPFVPFNPRLWTWSFAFRSYSSNGCQEDNMR